MRRARKRRPISKQEVVAPTAEAAMKWQEIVASVAAEWAKRTPPAATKLLAAFHGLLREVRAGR